MKHKLAPWTPFQPATLTPHAKTPPSLRDLANSERGDAFINSRYVVIRTLLPGGAVWLSIRSLDRLARHDWRDFQRIKNDLVHPEAEAIEIYPAESRLVDTSNQFHLWVLPHGQYVPFGFTERVVSDQAVEIGAKQRPFEKGARPADARILEEADLAGLVNIIVPPNTLADEVAGASHGAGLRLVDEASAEAPSETAGNGSPSDAPENAPDGTRDVAIMAPLPGEEGGTDGQ